MSVSAETTYTCGICAAKSRSLKELTAHYEKEHQEMIEDLMMPI